MSVTLTTFRTSTVFIIIVLVLLLSLQGAVFPQPIKVRGIGGYQVGVFDTGLSLFQTGNVNQYFSVSPFNDYILSSAGFRQPLLTGTDYHAGVFTTSVPKTISKKLLSTAVGYFIPPNPAYSLSTDTTSAQYQAHVSADSVIITRKIKLDDQIKPLATAITVTISNESIIFDDQTLYTPVSEAVQAILQNFSVRSVLNPPATEMSDQRYRVSGQKLYIMDPRLADIIVITPQTDQVLWVDLDLKLIELVTPYPEIKNNMHTDELHISVIPSIKPQ
ncbi:MAG: hypothetical protein M3Q81_01645 [bacterium]|nr:hypothetical protein [bacterium]